MTVCSHVDAAGRARLSSLSSASSMHGSLRARRGPRADPRAPGPDRASRLGGGAARRISDGGVLGVVTNSSLPAYREYREAAVPGRAGVGRGDKRLRSGSEMTCALQPLRLFEEPFAEPVSDRLVTAPRGGFTLRDGAVDLHHPLRVRELVMCAQLRCGVLQPLDQAVGNSSRVRRGRPSPQRSAMSPSTPWRHADQRFSSICHVSMTRRRSPWS